jgi:intein/homing endonuclease
MATLSWEYIAGFFDGEGCITLFDYDRKRVYKKKPQQRQRDGKEYSSKEQRVMVSMGQNDRAYIQLVQVNTEVLEKIGDFLNENNIAFRLQHKKKSEKNKAWSDITIMFVSRHKDVEKFLEGIYPFLIVKRLSAQIALDFIKQKVWGKHNKHERGWKWEKKY